MPVVVFDLFGVIARHQSAAGRERIERVAGAGGPAFWRAYWDCRPPYDRGEQLGPRYWRAVGAEVGLRFTEGQAADLVAADIDSWNDVDGDMVALVGELATRGHRLGLLSNIPPELATHYECHHGWLARLDVLGLSCRIGHVKPDRRAFEWCVRAFGVAADELLMVDDRADNIEAAQAAGMRGHLFTSIDGLRAELRPAGGDTRRRRV